MTGRLGRIRWLLAALAAAVFLCAGAALAESGTCGDHINWTLDDAGLLVITGSGTMNDFEFGQYTEAWTPSRAQIRSVRIEEGVTSVGAYAFEDCGSLTSVTLPESLEQIGESAFRACNLQSVFIPAGVESIGYVAFGLNNELTAIQVSGSNAYFTAIDGALYNKAGTELISCPTGKTAITIPEGVTSIATGAFRNCAFIDGVVLPESLTQIGEIAFGGCTSLTEITIPAGVARIENNTFSRCTSLTSVTLAEGVTSIGNTVFKNDTSLTSIIIPESVTSIGTSVFYGCSSLTIYGAAGSYAETYANEYDIPFIPAALPVPERMLTLPAFLIAIESKAFAGLGDGYGIEIPESVTSIADDAFTATGVTIIAPAGSYAAGWAKAHGIPMITQPAEAGSAVQR